MTTPQKPNKAQNASKFARQEDKQNLYETFSNLTQKNQSKGA